MTREIPVLQINGAGFDCGKAVGRAMTTQIRANIETYGAIFARMSGVDRAAVHRFALSLVPTIEAYAAHLVEEMRGLADGAGVPFADIVALNARTEIMYGLKAERRPQPQPGPSDSECTSIGVLPEVTRDGHTLIGENWDWRASVAGRTAILALAQPGRPRVLVFTEAGFVGKIGLNEAGIGVCANLLASSHDRGQIGVPYHLILRHVLDGTNMHHAIRAVTLAQRGSSGNYLIGSRGGEVIDLEATPETFGHILTEDGILTHSNHFLCPELCSVDTHLAVSTMTFIRNDRARRLISRERGKINADSFVRVLRDHFSHPHAICRHADPAQPEEEQSISGASIIMDLDEATILAAAGPPCENEYRHLAIDGSPVR